VVKCRDAEDARAHGGVGDGVMSGTPASRRCRHPSHDPLRFPCHPKVTTCASRTRLSGSRRRRRHHGLP
jgi:hypothetical protein